MVMFRMPIGFTGLTLLSASSQAQICTPGRTLERQIRAADVVILGQVTNDRDCSPPDIKNGRMVADCGGRKVGIKVLKDWKGTLRDGDRMFLLMKKPRRSSDLVFHTNEQRVIFGRREGLDTAQWIGTTDRCMYPEGIKSEKLLISKLDAWKKLQSKKP